MQNKVIKQNILILVFTSSLIACSYFSPSYQKPQLDTPNTWSASTANIGESVESLPYLAWWSKFNDPQLNQLIESGLANNMRIQIAKANLEAAQGQLQTVKLNWLPFVNIFGGYINGSSQNTFAPLGNLGAIGNTGAFYALMPQYTLNLFTNYALQQQAEHVVDLSKDEELSIRLAVVGQITSSYFIYLAQLQLLEQYKQLNSKALELVDISTKLATNGVVPQIEANDIKSKQKLVEGQIALIQGNLTASQNALRFLINQAPGAIISGNHFAAINPNQIIPGNLPVNVIADRPDIMKAEAQLKAANEGISVASSSLLPSANLNYFYAQSSNQVNNNSATNLSTSQNYSAAYANWIISPSVFGQINTNSAIFKAALANYKLVVNSALHEVDNALAANNSFNNKMYQDKKAMLELQASLATKTSMYKKGVITYAVLLTAQMEQNLLEIDLTQTKLQQLISLVSLYQSLGGGYNYNESQSIKIKS